jgi:hypothetical protein
MKGGGFEGVANFVDDGEEDIVYTRIKGAIASAIQVIVIGVDIVQRIFDPGRLVELGIDLEQLAGVFFPALVAEHIDLGNDADLFFGAGPNDLFDIGERECEAIRELGTRLELIMVIDENKKGIDLSWGERVMYKVYEGVDAVRSGGADAEPPDGHDAVEIGRRLSSGGLAEYSYEKYGQ